MEKCADRTQIPLLPSKVNGTEKLVKSEIKLCLPFIQPDLVYKVQMIS